MNVSSDIYSYIAKYVDDRTMLNMLSVNKKFNDPKFFKIIIDLKYPGLIKHKKIDIRNGETWRDFFLEMTYYIYKLKEDYGIPYIHDVDESPKELYEYYVEGQDNKYAYDRFMDIAAYDGDLDYVKLMVEKGATDFNSGLESAAKANNMDIVKYMLLKGATKLNQPLVSASSRNNLEMVKYLVEHGATDIDRALEVSAVNGNSNIVDYLISIGSKNYEGALGRIRINTQFDKSRNPDRDDYIIPLLEKLKNDK